MKSPLASRSVGGVEWLIRPEFSQALEPVLTDLALPVDNPRHTVFKNQPGGTAIFTFKPNRPDLPAELFVKIYRYPDWRSRLRRWRALLRSKIEGSSILEVGVVCSA